MKKIIVLISALLIVACQSVVIPDEKTDPITNRQDLLELLSSASNASLHISEENIMSGISSLLSTKSTSTRSGGITMKKSSSFTVPLEVTADISRSGIQNLMTNVELSVYEVNDGETQYSAITSNDQRIGGILALFECDDFEKSVEEDPFLNMFMDNLHAYIQLTADEWNQIAVDNKERSYSSIVNSSQDYNFSNFVYYSGNTMNIMKTKWGQKFSYNDAIESIKKVNYPTGCGTTAVAQILAFHEYPTYCQSTVYSNLKTQWSLISNWDGHYNWKAIKEKSDADLLPVSYKTQVSTLMYEVAEGLKVKYSLDGTSVNNDNFIPFFNTIGYKQGNSYTGYKNEHIKQSIDNGSPVITVGYKSKTTKWFKTSYNGGHVWVIDGYCNISFVATNKKTGKTTAVKDDFVHCNAGWYGNANGWYLDGCFTMHKDPISDQAVENAESQMRGTDNYYKYVGLILTNIRPK